MAGGVSASGTDLASAEFYDPNAAPWLGSLTVTINPAGAVSAGAQWQLDCAGAFFNSGAVVANMPAGSHTIAFKTVDGWTAPGNQTVVVRANLLNTATGTYAANGALQMTLNPPGAVSAGAQWRVDGGAFQPSGAVVTNLSPGNHTVSFNTVIGWTAPASQTVVVNSNTTNSSSATYAANGALQIMITPPAAVAGGAQWKVDGGALQNSGAVVTNLSPGNHRVSFSTVAGWATPANRFVLVSSSSTNSVTATYVQWDAFHRLHEQRPRVSHGDLVAQWEGVGRGRREHERLSCQRRAVRSGHRDVDGDRPADHRPRWSHGDVAAQREGAGRGRPGNSGYLSSAELYDPATGTWTATGSLEHRARISHGDVAAQWEGAGRGGLRQRRLSCQRGAV